ncbi:MAG: hypothetical protein J6Y03_03120, partial [Alphaproteobacteria bacterium]|nr:hypothetical protein [Alphaproteobacteria bacterium]
VWQQLKQPLRTVNNKLIKKFLNPLLLRRGFFYFFLTIFLVYIYCCLRMVRDNVGVENPILIGRTHNDLN